MKLLRLALLVSLLALTSSPLLAGSDDKDIDLAGVRFGQTVDELMQLARAKGRKLVGPSKGILDLDNQVQCTEYAVEKDRSLSGRSGVDRQSFMILNQKVLAVELHFSTSSSYKKFIEEIGKLGYKEEKEGLYAGELKTGNLSGSKVEVRVTQFKGGNKGNKMKYIINARCLEVLGKGITLEEVMKAQGREPRKDLKKDPRDALKGLL